MSQHSLADVPPVGLDTLERLLKVRDKAQREVQRDVHHAERGERLAALVHDKPVADVWSKDLLPLLTQLWDAAEENITPGSPGNESLQGYKQALRDFVELVGGHIQLGRGAIRRLASRKLERVRYEGA